MQDNPSNLVDDIEKALSDSAIITTEAKDKLRFQVGTEGFNTPDSTCKNLIAVIKATKVDAVKRLVDLANKQLPNDNKFVIYPVSTGLNWGYGTGQPPQLSQPTVILDLGLLTHIEFDAELGLVTIEPGVTQQILADFIDAHGGKYMVPVTGAGPDCSIMSNALERGYGITPYTDHFAAVNSLKGIWANGDKYHSAVYGLDNSSEKLVDKTFKWGLGPYLEGLFTQSNLGIVTNMTIRLAQKPEKFISFIIQIPKDEDLENTIPLIRKVLRNYEGIVGSINLMDKRRVLSMFAQNPNPGQHQVMSDDDINRLSNQLNTPSWTVMGSIYGTKGISKNAKKEIKQLFKQIECKQVYSDSILFPLAQTFINFMPNFLINKVSALQLANNQLASFSKGKEIMLGKPNKMALKLAYWRHKTPNVYKADELSPAKDGCGLLWYAPLLTMKPHNIRGYVDFIRSTCPSFNIEPLITFTNLKHDCVDSTVPIVFDLQNKKATADAKACLNELVNLGRKKGYVPYRLNIEQQQNILAADSPYWITVNKIKSALDPNGILSPGRYNPTQ